MSIFIIAVSLLLFLYWFRYTCLLILSAKTSRDYAQQVAAANQLSFIETRKILVEDVESKRLDSLHQLLDRDYRLLTYLLHHGTSHYGSSKSIETRILMIDYRIMQIWYAAVQNLSPAHARSALLEMTSIINHLANAMGERLAVSASVGA